MREKIDTAIAYFLIGLIALVVAVPCLVSYIFFCWFVKKDEDRELREKAQLIMLKSGRL